MSGAYNPSARVLWTLSSSGLSTTLAGAGTVNGPVISLLDTTDLWLAVYVAGTSTGTNPTLDAQIDIQDADGNWYPQVAKIFQLTATPNYSSVSCGLHIAGAGSMVLPQFCRVTWILGGTNPVFPKASISLHGR